MRGISLLETTLALAIGAGMIAGSVDGIHAYQRNIKIKASAAQLNTLHKAADIWAEENFSQLVSNAPQTYDVSVLDAYTGQQIRTGPYREAYHVATATYDYQDLDLAGDTEVTRTALQVVVVAARSTEVIDGENDDLYQAHRRDTRLRAEIALQAGPDAAWYAFNGATCYDSSGNEMPDRSICAAYGNFTMERTGAWDEGLANGYYLTFLTKGDSTSYDNKLYRPDLGDEELNTMHADLRMDGNSIVNVREITELDSVRMEGATATIRNNSGELSFLSSEEVRLQSEAHSIVLHGDGSSAPAKITSRGRGIQIGRLNDQIVVGEETTVHETSPSEPEFVITAMDEEATLGTGDVITGRTFSKQVRTESANSLLGSAQDPLKIQNFRRGEVIVGQRGHYTPPAGLADSQPTYELSDGLLTAGHVKLQDITCADCGGTLSDILPRWRQMGTYLVENNTTYKDIPKPNCVINHRDPSSRPQVGERHHEYRNTQDARYIPNILLLPKQAMKERYDRGRFNIQLEAEDIGNSWRVRTDFEDDNVLVEALAMTFCVFVGGTDEKVDITNPTNASFYTRMDQPDGGWWTRLTEDDPISTFVDNHE